MPAGCPISSPRRGRFATRTGRSRRSPAAFEMDEILWELRSHSSGLNIGRWDYIFSCIKKLLSRHEFCLADRSQVAMTSPFMRAYALLLIKTCHRRYAPTPMRLDAMPRARRCSRRSPSRTTTWSS
ncbi:MAG: hypothetical protein ACXWG9_16805 [Usitatibacter sp.]